MTKSPISKNNPDSDDPNVRAMQYRDLFKASDNSKFTNHEKVSKRAIIQPLMLALLFVLIFCLSIGTVAYLTYNQRLTQAYPTVNVNQNNDLTEKDVTLKKFTRRQKSVAVDGMNE